MKDNIISESIKNGVDPKYIKFVGPCAGGQKPSEGCNVPDGGLTLQNLNGSKKALAPENRFNLGVNYNSMLSNGLEFGFNMNVKASDDYRKIFPIPEAVLLVNSNLTQNPNY